MYITVQRQLTVLLCIALYIVVYVRHVSGYTFGPCQLSQQRQNGSYTTFECFKRSLCCVPQNIPLDITGLNISHNKIIQIKSGDFINLTCLETLDMSSNLIIEVDKKAFRDLIKLTELYLNHNRLTRITKDLFHGLSNLKLLLLENNNISTIENSAFSIFHKLECVKLSSNKIRDLKQLQPIFRIQSLNEIHIPSNNISIFQSIDISNSSLRLKILDLAHNPLHIFRIRADIFPFLEEINLSYCFSNENFEWEVLNTSFFRNVKTLYMVCVNVSVVKFNVILKAFNNSLSQLFLSVVHPVQSLINSTCLIPTLRNLTMSNNNITSLNRTGLEKCLQLKALDLYNNKLSDSENIFASLKNLTSLKLGYNNFFTIPKMIQHLSMLEYLDFVFNQIGTLDCLTFKNLYNLKILRLYGNRITVVKYCVFQHLMNLKGLYLGSNGIKYLDGAFKNGPSQLRVLEISSNSLTSLKNEDFRGLKSLRTLILDDNKINSIADGTFDALINLKLLNLQSNKITDQLLRPTVFSGLSNLTILYLQKNHILKTHIFHESPFYNLKSLQVLYLLSQQHHTQSFLPYNLLQNLTHLDSFWAQNIGLKYVSDDLFKDNIQLTEVALSKNNLISLSASVFLPLQRLSKLHLDGTRLKTLDFIVHANLHKLKYLQVSNNQITSINDTIVKSLPELRLLDMQGNTFTCDCSNAWLVTWIQESNQTQVTSANMYECNSPPALKQTNLLHLDVHSCSVDIEFFCYISSMSLVLLTLIISLIYHFLHWQIVYAYYLFLAFLYDKNKKSSNKSLGFQYDAFVSYNTLDELWVINELLPKLEGEQGWRLCLHHRDFLPGKPIVDNIVDGIYSSRKTICVVSQHYLESEWCSREVQVASFRLFDEKKDVLILVFLEDIPVYRLSPYYRMRGLVKKRTYLSWPKAGQDTRVFWEKLRVALGARGGTEEENSISDVQNAL